MTTNVLKRHSHYIDSGWIESADTFESETPAIGECLGGFVHGLAGSVISEDFRRINYYRDHAEFGLTYDNLPCIGAEV